MTPIPHRDEQRGQSAGPSSSFVDQADLFIPDSDITEFTLKCINMGGFGELFLARHRACGKVALKRLRVGGDLDEMERQIQVRLNVITPALAVRFLF